LKGTGRLIRSWLLVAPVCLIAVGCPGPGSSGKTQPPSAGVGPGSQEAPSEHHDGDGDWAPDPNAPRPVRGIPAPDDDRNQLGLLRRSDLMRVLAVGGAPLQTYLAISDPSRQLGLMHVHELPENEGMLFVFPSRRQRGFWMKNTFIRLSLAYVRDDGTIDQILDMEPHVLSSYRSRSNVRYVLEVNQGWFERHEVEEGDKIVGLEGLRGYR
jgi:uncharacterized protein